MSIADRILLRKRALIETANDELKNITQIEHSRHRSFSNFIANSLSAIAAYCFFEKKPAIEVNFINDGQLTIFWFYVELTLIIFNQGGFGHYLVSRTVKIRKTKVSVVLECNTQTTILCCCSRSTVNLKINWNKSWMDLKRDLMVGMDLWFYIWISGILCC